MTIHHAQDKPAGPDREYRDDPNHHTREEDQK
jgi:hypothetical protein